MTDATKESILESIETAESINDPLDGLVERAKTGKGAPCASEVRERLATPKKEDLAEIGRVCVQVKATGCRVTVLDNELADWCGATLTGRSTFFVLPENSIPRQLRIETKVVVMEAPPMWFDRVATEIVATRLRVT